ncbi:NlpC/P60 family protein [Streptomyces parvus]|uniref:NlpC/P60 family protein n=1 Tax=Streptomyces parvus TaxID=66428 RepID=UPI003D73B367
MLSALPCARVALPHARTRPVRHGLRRRPFQDSRVPQSDVPVQPVERVRLDVTADNQIGLGAGTPGPTGGGFDCSGLHIHAFRTAGITLPRISQPMDGSGNRADRADVQPGGSLEKFSAATAAIACREPANWIAIQPRVKELNLP